MKLTKTSLATAAFLLCLGTNVVLAADAATPSTEPTLIIEEAIESTDEVDLANPEMNSAELQAEIRIACEEFAVDEKVAEDKVPEFVDACVAENMPAEEADTIETVDSQLPEFEELAPEATPPVVAGQAKVQE